MTADKLMTLKQIADALGRSDKTIRRKFKAGELPGAFKLDGRNSPIKMPRSALDRVKRGQ